MLESPDHVRYGIGYSYTVAITGPHSHTSYAYFKLRLLSFSAVFFVNFLVALYNSSSPLICVTYCSLIRENDYTGWPKLNDATLHLCE